jgi:hypothetical protein
MVSPFLDTMAKLLAERGIAVWRFEFAYMAARRDGGCRKPPPKAERLMDEYRAAVAELPRRGGDDRRQVDGRTGGEHGRDDLFRRGASPAVCSATRSIRPRRREAAHGASEAMAARR